jgi:hypothetical protein
MKSDIIKKIKSIDENNIIELTNLYIELIKDNKNDINHQNYIDYLFYSLKKYEYFEIKTEIIETMEEREKRLDTLYKETVKNKYKTCMITGKPDYLSQVAHIYPFKLCNPEEKYDPENGFLLSAELHILFDTIDSKLKIDPETELIKLSEDILINNTMEAYHKFHNTKILLSNKNKHYLRKKYSEFINY